MNAPLIYSLTVAAIFATLLLVRIIPFLQRFHLIPVLKRFHLIPVLSFFLKEIAYPFIYRRMSMLSPITRLQGLVLTVYILFMLFCNLRGVSNAAEASTRAGWLSAMNMIPLFVSGRLAMAAKILGFSLREISAVHNATSFMVVSEALTHISLELRRSPLHFGFPTQFWGFLVRLPEHRID